MIIDFSCPDCSAVNSHHWKEEKRQLSALVGCQQCAEVWGVVIDGDNVTIVSTGDPIDTALIVTLGRENPSSDSLQIFKNPQASTCEYCGLEYDDFKTNETFETIRDMLWIDSDRPEDWNYKGRHTILGKWHQIKQSDWRSHIKECEEQSEGGQDDTSFPFGDLGGY